MRLTPSELRVTANDITVRGSGNEQAYVGGDGVGADAEFGSFNSAVDNAVMWNRARGDRLNLYVKTLFESSDRELKAGFEKIEPQEILAKVLALPIERWHFRGDETNRHIGPMAQDFRAAFGLGRDDKSIASVDANGVALAAIQGLNIAMEAKEARIKELEARLIATERQLTEQRKLHADWESRLAALEKQRASFAADASR